jgi:broad specificity phosphatase PhoE
VSTPPRPFLARHGETDYNRKRRFQGRLPIPLNDAGRAQAAELAELAASRGFVKLWCSPLARARETADIVSARIGLAPHEDARLVETDAGDWTDLPFADVQAADPERFAAFVGGHPNFRFPGGESFAEQGRRVAAALAEIEADLLPALVVCHGVVIRIALSQRRPEGLSKALLAAAAVPNGALLELPPAHGQDPVASGAD